MPREINIASRQYLLIMSFKLGGHKNYRREDRTGQGRALGRYDAIHLLGGRNKTSTSRRVFIPPNNPSPAAGGVKLSDPSDGAAPPRPAPPHTLPRPERHLAPKKFELVRGGKKGSRFRSVRCAPTYPLPPPLSRAFLSLQTNV